MSRNEAGIGSLPLSRDGDLSFYRLRIPLEQYASHFERLQFENAAKAEAARMAAVAIRNIIAQEPPTISTIYVQYSDDGQHIRKWCSERFEGGEPVLVQRPR